MRKLFNQKATTSAFADMRKEGLHITRKELIRAENDMLKLLEPDREELGTLIEF